jgi:hypothetical protein
MQRCLLYKIVDAQDKCDQVGDQRSEEGADYRLKDWQVRGVAQIRKLEWIFALQCQQVATCSRTPGDFLVADVGARPAVIC